MRAVFYVFSGTGNTRRVCEEIVARWKALGHEADLAMIRADESGPSPEGYDLIVVGYPVHAFNAPAAVLKFLKKLPMGDKKAPRPAYLVRTSGEPLGLNDASGITPRRILKKRGYRVLGEFRYVMPYNIIFRHSDGMAARMWRDAKLRMDETVGTMSAFEEKKVKVNPFKRMVSFVLRIEHTAMPVVGRTFKAAKTCIGCGKCAKVCPQGNIAIKDGRPVFGGKCVACMACAFSCPEDAVRTSLLNGWRVNGAYPLDGEPAKDEEVGRYCRKAYLRYFHETEEKSAPRA